MIIPKHSRHLHLPQQRGYTLAEMLVGVGILAVTFTSLYTGLTSAFMLTRVARESSRATQVMLDRIEGLRLYSWDQLTQSNMVPSTFTARYYPAVGGEEASGVVYTGTLRITDPGLIGDSGAVTPSYSANLRAIEVEVRWKSGDVDRVRRMTTLASRDGSQNYLIQN